MFFFLLLIFHPFPRRTKPYRWFSRVFCCKTVSEDASRKMLRNQRTFTSSTITTSLTSSSARSTSIHRPNKIVNFEQRNEIPSDTNGRWHHKQSYFLYAWKGRRSYKLVVIKGIAMGRRWKALHSSSFFAPFVLQCHKQIHKVVAEDKTRQTQVVYWY